ncbi:GYF domain-containing protein [Polyangium mundeleinium]|uniref:GYF domain-containing protein n=1 Tax=Polyangium mundeleinium TaxID=2995306 RepID=A0ABT5F4W1_9BACT|nr:GYF domain-containing protein [Polyangium mundeleinium]MDC0748458.1 GYF domain-containing protein [Polyangium mundeleinium]
MTSRDEWRWTDEQGVQRLVRTEELREAIATRVLPPSVLVWREGMAEWVPAFTVPEFADATPTTQEPAAPRHEPSTISPFRFGATLPEKRGQMGTLLGLTGPGAPQQGVEGAPIVVPSGGGTDAAPPGAAPITLRPEYGGAAFEAALPRSPNASPEPPAAVRPPPPVGPPVPGPVADAAARRPPTSTSAVDELWGNVNDDETTNVGDLAPPAAKPPKETTAAALPKPAMVAPRAAESPAKPPHVVPKSSPPPAGAAPVKPAEGPRGKAGASAENTSVGLAPKPLGPKTSEYSTVGPSPMRAPSKVFTKPTEPAARPAASPTLPRPVADKSADKPSAILRPSALLKPAPVPVPRAGATPGTSPAKASPSAPPPAPIEPPAAQPPATPADPPAAAAPPPLAATEPPPAMPPSEVTSLAELAPVTAPSRIDELPPAPPPREPSTTAILPPDLNSSGGGYTGPSMAGAVKFAHEVTRTIRIDALLADPSTSPLPEKEAAARGSSGETTTLPSALEEGPFRGAPPPPAVEIAAVGPNTSYTDLPRGRAALDATSDGMRAVSPEQAASSLPLKVIATSCGLLVMMVISAFFVGRCSVKPTVAGGGARSVLANTVREIRDALPQPPKPCWVAKQPVRWAPVVSNKVPFELLPLASGNVSIGYAKSSDEAVGIEVTPSSGQVNEGFVEKVSGEIDRVAPTGTDKGYFVAAKEAPGALKSIVQVPASTAFFLGVAEGSLATADGVDAAPQALWPIAGTDPLDAARVVVADDKGYALSFRRDGAVMGGFIGPDRKPIGELVKVVGSGGQVGKPMSGWNGREVAILFADRQDDQSPWKIRLGHAPVGSIPATTEVIELPAGGPGGDAFAPGIAGLPDGRWVLIWTEGSAGARAVRAQTLGPDFVPVGDPIALSPPAGNFGQGMAAVAGAYVTAVFLQRGKSSYELWGGVLQCG